MADSDDDVRDDDDTILDNQSGDAAKEADGDKPGDSLTTSETSDPRKTFMDQYSTEEKPSGESDEEIEANVDDEDEQKDDVSADELPDDDAAEDSAGDEDQIDDDSDDDDEDEDDLGIDLSGILDEDEDVADEFDPRQDLNKKIWKSTPKEAQQLITKFRRNYKKQIHQAETEKPFADWSRSLLTDATNAGMNTDDLMTFIDLGLRAHQGHPEAIEVLGHRMVEHGYAPAAPAPNLSGIQDYLKTQVDSLEMDREVAVKVMELVNGSVGKTSEASGAEAAPAPAPTLSAPRQRPGYSDRELENAAISKIAELDKRYEERLGEAWPSIRKRVSRNITLDMAEHPVSHAQWAATWNKHAERESKAYLKAQKVKKKKSRSKLRSTSDSLERGAPIAVKDSGTELTGRAAFHKQHSR